jgi:nucleoid-associated protein YgaU
MIESRYTIEYVNPDSKRGAETKKPFILLTFLGLIIFAALAYAFFAINQSNDFASASNDNQELEAVDNSEDEKTELAPISAPVVANKTLDNTVQNIQQEIDMLLLKNEKQASVSTQQLKANKKLNHSIDNLTKQLMAERAKSKALDKQLNSQKNENSQLSNLLENALSKASSADKNYLSALDKLEKTTEKNKTTKVKIENKIEPKSQVIVRNTQNTKKTNSFNSISLSTSSQIDAIIAAMQGTTKSNSTLIKTHVDKTKEIRLAAVSKTSPTELLHIQLQRQIDQIISTKNTKSTKNSVSSKTNSVYKKALEKESDVRKNAVRSITIKKGETLWSIAQRAYGNGGLYKKIIEANPQINIKQLFVGQVIRVPK